MMKEITFDQPVTGQFCQESPDGMYVALIKHGVSLVIRERYPHQRAAKAGRARADVNTTSSSLDAPKGAVVGHYGALDQVSGILWSPDSSMIALLLRVRGTVEIVTTHNTSCVARIDAGLDGVKLGCWHPSSTAFYYFGRCNTHIVSLTDGATTLLEGGGVKLAETWHYTNELIKLDSSSGMAFLRGDDVSSPGCVLRPLLRFSSCGRFLFVIAPITRDASSMTALPNETVAIGTKRSPTATTRTETLNIFSATTHEVCAKIDIVALCGTHLGNITDFHVLPGAFLIFDEFHRTAAIIRADGRGPPIVTLDNVDAVSCADGVVACCRRDELLTYVTVGGSSELPIATRFVPLAPLPLAPRYLPFNTPVLSEVALRDASNPPEKPDVDADGTASESKSRSRSLAHSAPTTATGKCLVCYQLLDLSGAATAADDDSGLDLAPLAFIRSFEPYSELALSNTATKSLFFESFAKHHLRQTQLGELRRQELEGKDNKHSQSTPAQRALEAAIGRVSADEDLSKREFNFLSFHRCAHISVCPGGRFIAVVPQSFPSTVFVVDVEHNEVHTVLRHSMIVTALSWRPRGATGSANRDGADINSGALLNGDSDALLICTDTHDGYLFLWQPTKATTISIPQVLFKDLYAKSSFFERLHASGDRLIGKTTNAGSASPTVKRQFHVWSPQPGGRTPRRATAEAVLRGVSAALMLDLPADEASLATESPVGFRVNRIVWACGASPLQHDRAARRTRPCRCILCDDMRGAYIAADLCPTALEQRASN